MKLTVNCAWCSKEITRSPSQLKGKKHHFCSRKCLADFSNKSKNPDGYASLKDYTKMGEHLRQVNIALNPKRMTPDVKAKLRAARLNTGEGVSYTKLYGRHEHRCVAEAILGRKLQSGEIVHHRDGNKRNNCPENIVVFPSQSAHAKHHAELRWFINEIKKIEGGDAK